MAWGQDAPDAARGAARVKLSTDTCIVGGNRYFIRGCLDLPVRGEATPFRWLVWVELPKAAYRDFRSFWRQLRGRVFPVTEGTLAVPLPYSPPTIGLRVVIHDQGAGMRPAIAVQDAAYPLAMEQRDGLALEAALEKAGQMMHAQSQRNGLAGDGSKAHL